MVGVLVVFCIVYFFIATEIIDKTAAAVLGAGAVIGLHFISTSEALEAIDLNVLFLLIGMMVIVNILSETGVFEWLSIQVARMVKGNGVLVIIMLLLLTAILSAFLDNVTTVILIAPITILLTQVLELPTAPVLILEALFSNVGGTGTLVGDPPNILIGSETNLNFLDFMTNLGPVVVVIMLAGILILWVMLRPKIKTSPTVQERISKAHPEKAILQPRNLLWSLIIFGFVLIGFLFGHVVHLEPGIVALSGAMLLVVICRIELHKVLSRVEWDTIIFFAGLFMLIAALEKAGIFENMAKLVLSGAHGNLLMATMAILWASAFISVIVNNIPLVMAMIPVIKSVIPVFAQQMHITDPHQLHTAVMEPLFWALALGACLGGNGSLVGASANVIVAQVAARNNYTISFWGFARYGFVFMIGSLVICSAYLYLRFFI